MTTTADLRAILDAADSVPGLQSRYGTALDDLTAAQQQAATLASDLATYKVGDRVTRGGVTYRCLVAHGAAYGGTWGPPLPSVWAVVP